MFYEAARSAIGLRGHRGRRIRQPTAQSGRRSSAQGLLCPLCACCFRAGLDLLLVRVGFVLAEWRDRKINIGS